ncbi:MAG: hypothetical protein V2A61_05010 [Calditrichota bacterium]
MKNIPLRDKPIPNPPKDSHLLRYLIIIFWGLCFLVSSYVAVDSLPSSAQLERIAPRDRGETEDLSNDSNYITSDSTEVIVSRKYEIYHRPNCSWAPVEGERISLKDAVSLGYEPCPYCSGE